MKILREQKGFFQIELLLMTSIVLSLVMIWALIGMMINQQRNNNAHMVALFLAQGYLNLLEANKSNLIPEKINYDNQVYTVKIDDEPVAENIHCFKVNLEWEYNGQTENEVLQRQIIK